MKAYRQASTASHEKLRQIQNRYDFSFNWPFKTCQEDKHLNCFTI